MKSLIIVRHAKSSWENIMDDFNRPLNERGKHDAPEMAKRLLDKNIQIDTFISSPAKRARKTAALFIHEYHRNKDEIVLIPELYNAPLQVFYNIAANLDNSIGSVAIFAHNPGVTEFANSLTDFRIDEMPTCAVFGIHIHSDSWKDFETATRGFWFFHYPKLKTGND